MTLCSASLLSYSMVWLWALNFRFSGDLCFLLRSVRVCICQTWLGFMAGSMEFASVPNIFSFDLLSKA